MRSPLFFAPTAPFAYGSLLLTLVVMVLGRLRHIDGHLLLFATFFSLTAIFTVSARSSIPALKYNVTARRWWSSALLAVVAVASIFSLAVIAVTIFGPLGSSYLYFSGVTSFFTVLEDGGIPAMSAADKLPLVVGLFATFASIFSAAGGLGLALGVASKVGATAKVCRAGGAAAALMLAFLYLAELANLALNSASPAMVIFYLTLTLVVIGVTAFGVHQYRTELRGEAIARRYGR